MKPFPIPAAAYVRMSNEDQEYSIANQLAAIERYAQRHGFVIARMIPEGAGLSLSIEVETKERRPLR